MAVRGNIFRIVRIYATIVKIVLDSVTYLLCKKEIQICNCSGGGLDFQRGGLSEQGLSDGAQRPD
jgi:hypothetical protein